MEPQPSKRKKIIWTPELMEELKRLYPTTSNDDLARHFGTTPRAMYVKCNKLGLKRKHHPKKIIFTDRQDLWIRLNFPHMSNDICAMLLGISPRTLIRRARELGVVKTAQFMKECQAHMSKKAVQSHIKNGTYPPKGWYSPNLRKGEKYQFKSNPNKKIIMKNNFIKSPLNYTGGKHRLLPQLLPLIPPFDGQDKGNGHKFIDLFCGGANVVVNIEGYDSLLANDICKEVVEIYSTFQQLPTEEIISFVEGKVKQYDLSLTNAQGFQALRDEYNHTDNDKPLLLFTLICYSFNHQFRFNSKGEFNMPFGKARSQFNDNIRKNVVRFCEALRAKAVVFSTEDFLAFLSNADLGEGDYVYADPPYLITCATYNEKDGWNETDERNLLRALDTLDDKGVGFGLSNVLANKGTANEILKEWVESRGYTVYHLSNTYGNCSYHALDKSKNTTDEVFITNRPKPQENGGTTDTNNS